MNRHQVSHWPGLGNRPQIKPEQPEIFDAPSLWRIEAAEALGLAADDLVAAMSPGPAFPAALRSLKAALATRLNVIVDLGAGAGGVSEWMRVSTGATVYAIEPAEGARQAAGRAFPSLHVIEGTAASTTLPGGVADLVVMSGVCSLLTDLASEFAEADRLLAPSGHFAIADLFSSTPLTWHSGPNVFRSVEDLSTMLDRAGYTVNDVALGEPVPDESWAAVAEKVDDWIESNCADRSGYAEWVADRAHLRDQIESGRLLGGCIIAQRAERGKGLKPAVLRA